MLVQREGGATSPGSRTTVTGVAAALFSMIATGAASATAKPEAGPAAEAGAGPEPPPKEAPRADLTVRITGLNNDKGKVAVALFASARDFPKQERALQGQLTPIRSQRASVTFRNLRPGIYAVAVLHDENENSKMDFNFLGMPLEGYGFSNDASAPFGPPSFKAAAFELKPRASFITIKMRYFL